MSTASLTANPWMAKIQGLLGPDAGILKAMTAPLFIVMILAMMVLPLPPLALDLLFTFNIALSLIVMMVAATMKRPLDFAALPAVLLVTTLLRLSLNVASTSSSAATSRSVCWSSPSWWSSTSSS